MSRTHQLTSSLGPVITAYLTLKRALGRRFAGEAAVLMHLDRFLTAERPEAAGLTVDSFTAWSLTFAHLTPTVRRFRMRVARNFCLYARRSNLNCFVPDKSSFPTPHATRPPHIFTEEQIIRLLRVATELRPGSTSPLHAEVYRLAIVLLYTAGLRRGELVRLILSDYDAVEHTLLIRTSKFHKSRLVALSNDAVREIEHYLRTRRRLPYDASAPLLVSRSGGLRAYTGASLGRGMRDLFRCASIQTTQGRLPRVHDLRHTHAVHALLRWYQAGADVQAKLPVLATAMGHISIVSTAYYLAFVESIAEAASLRFERHCQDVLTVAARCGDEP